MIRATNLSNAPRPTAPPATGRRRGGAGGTRAGGLHDPRQRPGRGDGHHVGQPPRVDRADAEIIAAFQAANPGIKIDFTGYPGPATTAPRSRRPSPVARPRTSSASRKGASSSAAAGGDLPFIDLTGKVDVSGLTDTARGQVEVDGKVYGCPLAAYTVGIANNKPSSPSTGSSRRPPGRN